MKKIISTDKAPSAIGPYSQAIIANGMLFTSGQLPIDPKTNEFAGNDIESQAKQCMENIKAILESENLQMSKIIKTTIFLTDLGTFAKVNEIYARYFKENPPSRSTVQVAALPKGAMIEIEAIAITN